MTAGRSWLSTAAALAAIVQSSRDAMIAKTSDGVVMSWNEGATHLYGHPAETMLGRSIEVVIPPEDWPAERARYARVVAGQAESGYHSVRVRADGRRIEVIVSMSPLSDDTGVVVGLASVSRPASDKELADARFASLLEAAPDAMVCVDASGAIVLVNAQVSAVFGFPREELLGRPLELLLPDELHERHRGHRDRFFHDPRSRPMGTGLRLEARRRDGTTFPVEVSLAAGGGAEPLVIAAVRDVTAQRAIEAALRESENRLRQLAENVEAVFTLREVEPPAHLYISPGYNRLMGRDPAAVLADPPAVADLVHPDDRGRFDDAFIRTDAVTGVVRVEYRIVRDDGEVRWLRSSSMLVPSEPGRPRRVVTSTEDITERVNAAEAMHAAEAAARAANEAKNEFLSRMSHELRTPLNAVLGFSQLLEHNLRDTAHVESVRYVLRAGRHLLDLINEVLDIAAIEAGAVSLSPEPVRLATIADETVRLMRPVAQRTDVVLAVAGGPEEQYVLADRLRLRQILLNLLSNAIKYNRPGGNVWLSWSMEGGRSLLTVRDDGPGIPESLQSRLFTPFDRLGAEATEVEGTGVGLTVTRGLAELMNGDVTFTSVVGRGTSFTVDLPLATEPSTRVVPAADPGQEPASMTGPGTATATMLYIEDNEPNVRVMEAMLSLRPGWSVVHAALGTLGLEIARARHPDLVMLDLHLPDGFGLDVLTALKDDPATASIPVVVLSADASPHQIERLLAVGAAGYLTKPLSLEEILTLLDRVTTARDA
jgi:PAS domain S-box-containing protein